MRRPVRRVLLVGALIVFGQMAIRTLFDTFAPPVTYGARSAVSTYVAAVTYFALGFLGAWIVGRAPESPSRLRRTSRDISCPLLSHSFSS
jgi:hypothetical protein